MDKLAMGKINKMDKKQAVFRSLEIIENRIAEKLTVENISNDIYFSKYYYQRLFRETVGDSVMDYVMKRKLTLAGRELLETDKSVLDIALGFGYDSHEGFTRSFKAYMGVTPTEYRKYGLASISKKIILKERLNMIYSKNTDEIIRELNDFIVKAKDTAKLARKNAQPEYAPYFNTVADITDEAADNVKNILERATDIGERPDEITSLFNIVKAIDGTAYKLNYTALHMSVTVARGIPGEMRETAAVLCGKYREFALFSAKKSMKVLNLLKELSALIFKDMRKTAEDKIQAFIMHAKAVTEKISGYAYLQNEMAHLTAKLEDSLCDNHVLTLKNFEDCQSQLDIISFEAVMEISWRGGNTGLNADFEMLNKNIADITDFFRMLDKVTAENCSLTENTAPHEAHLRIIEDLAYFSNILLFYANGEVFRMGGLLSGEQKSAFDIIFDKIGGCIQFALNADDKDACKKTADMFAEAASEIERETNKIEPESARRPMLVLVQEFAGVYDKIAEIAEWLANN